MEWNFWQRKREKSWGTSSQIPFLSPWNLYETTETGATEPPVYLLSSSSSPSSSPSPSSSSSSSSSECSVQRQGFHCKLRHQGCSSAQSRSSSANSGTKIAVLPGMNRCGSFPLLSAPLSLSLSLSLSLFSIWRDLKRSEKIPGAPGRRWGEWIWLTGPSGLHQNSAEVKYQFRQGFWPDQRSVNPNHPSPPVYLYEILYNYCLSKEPPHATDHDIHELHNRNIKILLIMIMVIIIIIIITN